MLVRVGLVLAGLFIVYAVALIYLRLADDPGQFVGLHKRIDALYSTIATLTTVG